MRQQELEQQAAALQQQQQELQEQAAELQRQQQELEQLDLRLHQREEVSRECSYVGGWLGHGWERGWTCCS